jgi:hypothetical protein
MYLYVPGLVGALNVLVWFWLIFPVLNWPPVAVKVCVAESLLVTFTMLPAATVSDIGWNMKFEMVIDVPLRLDDPDEAGAPLILAVPPPHAARSRAPVRTRTPAPNFNLVRIRLKPLTQSS